MKPKIKLVKCPRCDLNYITPEEKYCKICLKEMRGEDDFEEVELCSNCNEAPAMPGSDLCLRCYRELNGSNSTRGREDDEGEEESIDGASLIMESVSDMDDIIPDIDENDIPPEIQEEGEKEISLEDVREEEEKEADDSEEEEEF